MKCKRCVYCQEDLVSRYLKDIKVFKCQISGLPIDIYVDGCEYYKRDKGFIGRKRGC